MSSRMTREQRRLVAAMFAAHVLGMLGSSAYPALLPELRALWGLSASEAGWISGVYFAGYVAGVPLLVTLTDRVDPRTIYLASTGLTGAAFAGFALFADGFWSALILHIWPGFGLAGTFMVGLRILTDRMEGPAQTRATSVYTSGYAAGMSLSFFAAGEIAATVGWRWAFGAAALGAVAAFAVAAVSARGPAPMRPERSGAHFLDYRPVMRNREALGYILAYGAHVWELFGARAWIVAFLTYAMAGATAEQRWIAPTVVAALFTLVGVPASIVGNELCLRLGRRATLTGIMVVSAAVSAAVGFTADWGYGAVALVALVYGMVLMADSASLTAGTVLAADPRHRGATMAMHSAVGFFGAFAAPVVFGAVLDAAGNGVAGWGLGFATLGVACALGPVALLALVRKDRG